MTAKRATFMMAVLAAVSTATVVWQRVSSPDANQQLRAAPMVNSESNALANSQLEQEVEGLRAQTRDLAKLRNEVSQLRARQNELADARAENAQLLDAKRTGAKLPREAPPGFISKEQLRNAGFETPENAVQTFFWAMREGELAVMLQGLVPENEERKQLDRMPPEKRMEFEKLFRAKDSREAMDHFNDFAVRGKEVISDDDVVLYIGSSLSTNTAKVKLARTAGEWRLHDLPK